MTELEPIQGDRFTFVTIGDNRADVPIIQPQAYRDCIVEINRLYPQPGIVFIVGDFILGQNLELHHRFGALGKRGFNTIVSGGATSRRYRRGP